MNRWGLPKSWKKTSIITVIILLAIFGLCNFENDPSKITKEISELNIERIDRVKLEVFKLEELDSGQHITLSSYDDISLFTKSLKEALKENEHLNRIVTRTSKIQLTAEIYIDGLNKYYVNFGVDEYEEDYISISENLEKAGVENFKAVYSDKLSYIYEDLLN